MTATGILKINKNLLILAGILDCKYMWYPILVYSFYIPVLISQLFALYLYWDYLDAVVETVLMVVCYILCYGQAAFCFFHRQDLQRIISYIEKKTTEVILKYLHARNYRQMGLLQPIQGFFGPTLEKEILCTLCTVSYFIKKTL